MASCLRRVADRAGGDTLLGTDTNGAGGWSITTMIPTNIPRGTYTYHAQATDSAGQVSTPVSITIRVVNDDTVPAARAGYCARQ